MEAVNGFTVVEEHPTGQLTLDEQSPVSQALDRTQAILRAALGTDEELADSAAEADQRALHKVRAFLQVLEENEAVCAVQLGDSVVSFCDLGQLRASIQRLSQDNLRESIQEILGELQGVLPKARTFEFLRSDTSQVIVGKIAATVGDADALNLQLHRPVLINVLVTRVGNGRPRYLLTEAPAGVEGA